MNKIEITNINKFNEQIEYRLVHTLTIPDSILNNPVLMNKAESLIDFFNTDDFQLNLVEIDGNKYIQSHRTMGFHITTSVANIKTAIENDHIAAQYILDNVQIPDFVIINKQVWNGTEWSEQ